MDHSPVFQIYVYNQALAWLKENPERLTNQEKQQFLLDLKNFLNKKDKTISDEVYDFLVYEQISKNTDRHIEFARFIKNKYPDLNCYNTLDVGAGRMCHLSRILARSAGSVFAMDPQIRLTEKEAKKLHITPKKELFVCDKFAPDGIGTDVHNFDLLVGLEPCMATEHIIRQGLEYDKPFDVLLCATAHNSLGGKKFKSMEDWYKYLQQISKEVKLQEYKNSVIATNNIIQSQKELYDGMEM